MSNIVGGAAAPVNASAWPSWWRGWLGARRGVAIRAWRPSDLEPVVRLWNTSFPRHHMTAARFDQQVCRSPWFAPSGCLVATAGPAMVGFLLISERRAVDGLSETSGDGFIECLAIDPSCAANVSAALVGQALTYCRQRHLSVVRVDALRGPCDPQGNAVLPREVACLRRAGFHLGQTGQELAMDRAQWDPSIATRRLSRLRDRGIEIRVATPGDHDRVGAALERWHGPQDRQCVRFRRGESLETFVMACLGEVVVGYCRWALVDGMTPYDRYGSLWVATTSPGTGHVYNLYVDSAHRSLGIGAALVASAFDLLSERGGRGLQGWTALPASQTRYQRWGFRPVGGVVFLSRRLR